jgi:hypothetical protein
MNVRKVLNLGAIALLLPHLFCCVLPAALAIAALVAPVGGSAEFHLLPHDWEPWMLAVSAGLLVVSWLLVLRKCDCGCAECADRGHRTQKIILAVATILFAIVAALHFFSHAH